MLHLSIEKATLLAAESRDPTAVASDRVESKRAVRIPADGPYFDALLCRYFIAGRADRHCAQAFRGIPAKEFSFHAPHIMHCHLRSSSVCG
jgi:hypothetical protein